MVKSFFLLVLLLTIHFFGISFIPQKINAQDLLAWLIMGFCFINVFNREGLLFKNALILFFVGILINIFSAFFNQGQSPYDTILSFGYYYFILFYFFLHKLEIEMKYLEKIIIGFAVFYSFLYICQVLLYPMQIVNSTADVSRGTIRLRIEGNGFLMLAYFMVLNRYLLNRKVRDILLAMTFFVVLLMGGFRTLSVLALLLSGLMFIRLVPFSVKNYAFLAFVALLFVGLFQVKGISNIVKGMVDSTSELIQEGEKYIRVIELKFFFGEFPINSSVYFLGSGLPGGESSYFRLMKLYEYNLGLFWTDLGIIGFYIMVGPVALAGLLWYSLKAVFIKIPKDKYYLSFYFAYLLVVSITTMEIYREGIFAVQAITLYLIDLAVREQQNKISTSDETVVY
jgi:hypothetical protein